MLIMGMAFSKRGFASLMVMTTVHHFLRGVGLATLNLSSHVFALSVHLANRLDSDMAPIVNRVAEKFVSDATNKDVN